MEEDPNITSQQEEIEALKTIYDTQFVSKGNGSYVITILCWEDIPESSLSLAFNFPVGYPTVEPPVFQINCSWMNITHISTLQNKLGDIFQERKPEPIVFHWLEYIHSEGCQLIGIEKDVFAPDDELKEDENGGVDEDSLQTFSIMASTPFTDRKSKFQAFVAQVYSVEDVTNVLKQLKSNKKIATATHNMYAYRIGQGTKIIEDREDDGEGGGGDKILYVLQVKKAENLLIVVTRWYGGIHLGQTRFKHITDCATNAYDKWIKRKYQQQQPSNDSGSSKVKLRTSEDIYNQIKWDPEYDSSTCLIGYMDRFEGMHEISFEEWPNSDIPFHRVWYFKLGDKIVWDRKKREDLLK